MKYIGCTRVGDLNSIRTFEKENPSVGKNQILVNVRAAGLTTADFTPFADILNTGKLSFMMKVATRHGTPFGGDISGVVTGVGGNVRSFHEGDEVYASIGTSGACAEYVAINADIACLKPVNISHEEAAAIPTGGIVAYDATEKAKIRENDDVMIYGASGGVGQFALQFAKARGAKVTAVCSTRNKEIALQMGAGRVIDYTKEDFREDGAYYDAIIGANGYNALGVYKAMLKEDGRYIAIGNTKQGMAGILGGLYTIGSKKTMSYSLYVQAVKRNHLQKIKTLVEDNMISPYVETVCTGDNIKETMERVARHHAQGKIVVKL